MLRVKGQQAIVSGGRVVRAGGLNDYCPPSALYDFTSQTSLTAYGITFTRGSSATYFDSTGTLQTVTGDTPRFDYDPSTLSARGLLIEEARTNSIRNNTMQGAVAGTPGTLPTNWYQSSGGLTQAVVGTGTENGITYIDVRFSGTSTGTQSALGTDTVNSIAASAGQTWAFSAYVSIVGGSTANITTIRLKIRENSSPSGSYLTEGSTIISPSSSLNRFSFARTLANASTAFISSEVFLLFAAGAAIDITIRIGLPQLELGAFATSVIPTTNAAATRNADVDSSTGSINTGAGTVFVRGTTAGGAGTQYLYSLDDGTANERAYIYRDSSNNIHCVVVDGGVTQCDLNLGAVAANTSFKVAFAYSANDFSASLNGGAVVTDTGGTLPTVTTRRFGQDQAPANYWNGRVARVAEYPRRLPDAYLQSLTG